MHEEVVFPVVSIRGKSLSQLWIMLVVAVAQQNSQCRCRHTLPAYLHVSEMCTVVEELASTQCSVTRREAGGRAILADNYSPLDIRSSAPPLRGQYPCLVFTFYSYSQSDVALLVRVIHSTGIWARDGPFGCYHL